MHILTICLTGKMALHIAVERDLEDLVQILMDKLDAKCAVERGHEDATMAPLQGTVWKAFLMHEHIVDGFKITPLRTMIRVMPSVAMQVWVSNTCSIQIFMPTNIHIFI